MTDETTSLPNGNGNHLLTALPPGGPWSRPYRQATAGLLLTIASSAFEALAVATVMPATVDDLGGLSYYGWAFSAFMFTKAQRGSHRALPRPGHPAAPRPDGSVCRVPPGRRPRRRLTRLRRPRGGS
jgi:hypothetical protein